LVELVSLKIGIRHCANQVNCIPHVDGHITKPTDATSQAKAKAGLEDENNMPSLLLVF
jgi:hypothetical protein